MTSEAMLKALKSGMDSKAAMQQRRFHVVETSYGRIITILDIDRAEAGSKLICDVLKENKTWVAYPAGDGDRAIVGVA